MIKYNLKKNNNRKSDYYGKLYAYPVIDETIDLDKLAAHMASHNTPFSKGVIRGLLTDMVSCIKELMLEGKNVKINDLAIFSIGIKNAKGGSQIESLSFGEHDGQWYGEVHLTIEPNRELRGRIMLYGENLEIISPLSLREQVIEILKKQIEQYKLY